MRQGKILFGPTTPNQHEGLLWVDTRVAGNTKALKMPINGVWTSISEDPEGELHTGDVTGRLALTIANKAVTLPKMADIATSSLIGRTTVGTGVPEVLSVSTTQTLLGITESRPQYDSASVGVISLTRNALTNLTDTSTNALTIGFAAGADGLMNDYGFVIRVGGTLRTVTWDPNIVWKEGTVPTLAINKTYYFVSSKVGTQYLTAFNTY